MGVWDEIAEELMEDRGPALQRFRVRRASPLVLEGIDSDDVLDEDDPDVDISDVVRQHRVIYGLTRGDVVRVLCEAGGWSAIYVESSERMRRLADDEYVGRAVADLRSEVDAAIARAVADAIEDLGMDAAIRAALEPGPWHVVGTAGEPAYQNGWRAYGGPWHDARFRREAGGHVIRLAGLVASGSETIPNVIFTLPAGFRPVEQQLFASGAGDADSAGRIDVYPDGTVYYWGGSRVYMSLFGLTFAVAP